MAGLGAGFTITKAAVAARRSRVAQGGEHTDGRGAKFMQATAAPDGNILQATDAPDGSWATDVVAVTGPQGWQAVARSTVMDHPVDCRTSALRD